MCDGSLNPDEPGKGDGFYLLAMGPNPFRLNKTHRSSGRVPSDVGAAIVEEQFLPCMADTITRHHQFRRIDTELFRWARPSDLTDTDAITRIRRTAPPAQPTEILPAVAELYLGQPWAPARAALPQWAANPWAEGVRWGHILNGSNRPITPYALAVQERDAALQERDAALQERDAAV